MNVNDLPPGSRVRCAKRGRLWTRLDDAWWQSDSGIRYHASLFAAHVERYGIHRVTPGRPR